MERMQVFRESEEAMERRCAGFGRVAVRLTILPSLLPGERSASAGMGTTLRFVGGGAEENNRLGETGFLSGSWNPAASSARISVGLRFVPSFTGQTSGIDGISWSSGGFAT